MKEENDVKENEKTQKLLSRNPFQLKIKTKTTKKKQHHNSTLYYFITVHNFFQNVRFHVLYLHVQIQIFFLIYFLI